MEGSNKSNGSILKSMRVAGLYHPHKLKFVLFFPPLNQTISAHFYPAHGDVED